MVAKKKGEINKKSESSDFDGDLFVIDEPQVNTPKEAKINAKAIKELYRYKDILSKYKNIAVYGMSEKEEKPSNYVPAYFVDHGYSIMPIHPKAKKIRDIKVSKTLEDVEGEIEILDVFRPSQDAVSIVKEVIDRKNDKGDIKVVWLQEGIVSDEAKKLAEDAGIEFVQDRCIYKEFVKILPERK